MPFFCSDTEASIATVYDLRLVLDAAVQSFIGAIGFKTWPISILSFEPNDKVAIIAVPSEYAR